jgi:hypothetical protein
MGIVQLKVKGNNVLNLQKDFDPEQAVSRRPERARKKACATVKKSRPR